MCLSLTPPPPQGVTWGYFILFFPFKFKIWVKTNPFLLQFLPLMVPLLYTFEEKLSLFLGGEGYFNRFHMGMLRLRPSPFT